MKAGGPNSRVKMYVSGRRERIN